MPQYTCPTCKTVVVLQSAVARGAVGQCTNCNGATITSKTINAQILSKVVYRGRGASLLK